MNFISINYINNHTEKEKLEKISTVWVEELKKVTSRDELIEVLNSEKNSVLQISVFDSSFGLIYDASNKGFSDKNFNKFFQHAVNNGSAFKFDTPYVDKESMLMYAVKIDNASLDEKGYVIVRFCDTIVYNNKPFWFSIIISTIIWLIVVIFEYFIIENSVKTIVKPLGEVENSLDKISKGDYTKERSNAKKRGILDNMFGQINEISGKISDTMRDLKYEQQKSSALMKFTNQGIIALSASGTIMLKNQAVDKIFQNGELEAGMAIDLLISEQKLVDAIHNALQNKTYCMNTYETSGRVFRMEMVNPSQTSDENFGEVCMLLVLTDISQEAKSAKIRSEFFANASHELKTPLTAINGYSELLGMGNITAAQQKKCIKEILENVSKMKNLLNSMLDLSKLDAQIVQEEFQEVDMRALAENVVKEFAIIAKQNEIELEINGEGKMLAMPKMMNTLLENLVSNAIKYNKRNGKVVINMERQKDAFTLSVHDTGIGITPEQQSRLFERFYKADGARTRTAEESTGLGLSIVKHIAMLHNGSVAVESSVGDNENGAGSGTTFIVKFA
ncbi:MAG: HAMP domain-containing sensor histidine kinase [Clostridia bacterium]